METTYIFVALIIFLGIFTQSLTGFGSVLVAVPLLSFFLDVKTAVPLAGIYGWLVTLPVVWKMAKHIQLKAGLLLALGSVPGSLLGAEILKHFPASVILMIMGIILIYSGISSLREKQDLAKTGSSLPVTLGAGFISGALGASVGESGPPVIAFTSKEPWSADQVKATLMFFFMLQMIGAVFGFWQQDLLTPQVFDFVIHAIPSFILGSLLGMFAYSQLHKFNINYHKIIHSFLILIGIVLCIKNI